MAMQHLKQITGRKEDRKKRKKNLQNPQTKKLTIKNTVGKYFW